MTKYYCDCCEKEITESNCLEGGQNSGRLAAEIKRNGFKLKVEILTSKDDRANEGLFCKYCVLDALYRLDDRPVPASPL